MPAHCINLGPGRPRTLEVREQLGVVIVSAWNLFAVESQPCIGRKRSAIVSTWNLALFEDTQDLARVVLLIVSAGACLLRQRCEDCDKGAKRGANHGLISSIFRIDETFRCMRGLFSRNNKTAFQQVECRFARNPLYQPGICPPSRTTEEKQHES